MSEQKRSTSGGSQPITRHPLFPAIVALWFGALFGLASMAIRPALIERAVVSLGIDSVIPMAAPPLGTTTRILIALAMTGIGGLIGALAARRITRVKPEVHERRRGTTPVAEEESTPAVQEQPEPKPQQRRRALSFESNTSATYDAPERAPLPGHDSRILNIAEFDLEGYEDADVTNADIRVEAAAESSLVGAEFVADIPEAQLPVSFDAMPAPSAAEQGFDAPTAHSFGEAESLSSLKNATFEAPENDAADGSPVPLSNGLFENFSRGIGNHSPAAVEAHDEVEQAAPFAASQAQSPSEDKPEPGFTLLPHVDAAVNSVEEPDAEDEVAAFASPAEFQVGEQQDEPAELHEASASVETEEVEESPAAVEEKRTAAERIVSAELDELSPVELLERLGLAMAQRREQIRQAAATPGPVLTEVAPDPEETADGSEDFAPVAFETEALEAHEAPEAPAPFNPLPFAAPHLESLRAEASPVEAEETASDGSQDAEPAEAAAEPAMPRIPAALRPVSLDDFDDDDDSLQGYIPPRHIGLSIAAKNDAPAPSAAPFAQPKGAESNLDDEDEMDEEESVLEQGYSSLLNLSRPLDGGEKPKQEFVRIDEPEDEGDIQPVVIFPGDEARDAGPFSSPTAASATKPKPAPEPESAGERIFGAPGKADPEETEKALRTALATLQRMSGAA